MTEPSCSRHAAFALPPYWPLGFDDPGCNVTTSGLLAFDPAILPYGVPLEGPEKGFPRRGLPDVIVRAGTLELRLSALIEELRQIQRLRYDVFYGEGTAVADRFKAGLGLDTCPFDRVCDHLYVVETAGVSPQVVGTYRLLRGEVAAREDGFYCETEFQLGPLLDRHRDRRLLELGRSCVHPAFRTRRVIDLLWLGVSRYAAHHGSEVLIGCASLAGTRAADLAVPLSFAFHHAAAPEAWQVKAHPRRAARMDWLDKGVVDARAALMALPPLMKAYVRAGATFASEAAVDHAFGTTDLFTVLPLGDAAPRYMARFGLVPAGVA